MNKPNQLLIQCANFILPPCWRHSMGLMQLMDAHWPEQCPPHSSCLWLSGLIRGCTLTYQHSCFSPRKPPNQQEIKVTASSSHLDFSFPSNIFIDISNENQRGQRDKAVARDLSWQTCSNHLIFKVWEGLRLILYLLNISGVAWLEISIFNQEQTGSSTQRTDWKTDGTKFLILSD